MFLGVDDPVLVDFLFLVKRQGSQIGTWITYYLRIVDGRLYINWPVLTLLLRVPGRLYITWPVLTLLLGFRVSLGDSVEILTPFFTPSHPSGLRPTGNGRRVPREVLRTEDNFSPIIHESSLFGISDCLLSLSKMKVYNGFENHDFFSSFTIILVEYRLHVLYV